MAALVAVVTGAGRGLGAAVAERLANAGWTVFGTERTPVRGQPGLELGDPESIDRFAAWMADHGPIDALVHNAAIGHAAAPASPEADARAVLQVNFRAPMQLTRMLAQGLAPNARLVSVSSAMGELAGLPAEIRAQLADPRLDRHDLDDVASAFLAAVARGDAARAGWPGAYSVSKALLNAWTRLASRELRGARVNAVCPGWVRTDMGGAHAPRTVAEGASGIAWAATLPPSGPTGGFFRDGARIPW